MSEGHILNCVYFEGFHYDRLPLIIRHVYLRAAASVEWILPNSLQISPKNKRLGENPRDTAQLLEAPEVLPCTITDPDTVKDLRSWIRTPALTDAHAPTHLIKIIRDLLYLLMFHIHHFLDSSFTRDQESSSIRFPISRRLFQTAHHLFYCRP